MSDRAVRWTLFIVSSLMAVSCGRTELLPRVRRRGELTLHWDDEHGVGRRGRALEAVPGHAEFGDIVAGQWGQRIIRVENTGLGPLVFEQVSGGSASFLANWNPETLAPGTSQSVVITFAPAAVGLENGRFTFTASNVEPGGESLDVLARGRGVLWVDAGVPDIEVTPFPRVDLGTIPLAVRPNAPAELEVRNVGLGTLTLTAPLHVEAIQGSADELCVGTLSRATGACEPVPQFSLSPSDATTVPLWLTALEAGHKVWNVSVLSNDPDEPVKVVEVVADVLPMCELSVTPLALDFGVLGTSPRELMVELRNRSAAPCHVERIGLAAGSDSVFSLVGAPSRITLVPGAAQVLPVRAWSQSASTLLQSVTGAVEIEVINANTPHHEVTLSATLGRSCLTMSPAELDFGTLRAGCASARRNVALINSCSIPITIASLAVDTAPEFQLTARTPIALQPATSTTVELEYRPVDIGADRTALRARVETGADQYDQLTMLRGRGAAAPENTESFRQGVEKTDVLLVIDDSCSMADKQHALAQNLGSFLNELRPRGVDFRIGVMTTTLPFDGGVQLSPFLESTTPDLEETFRQAVRVGIEGDARESCMQPAAEGLMRTPDFLRDGATLSVICVTDAPDQSLFPVEHFWNRFAGVRPSFTYNVVGPFLSNPPTECFYDDRPSPYAGRHEELARRTGGMLGEICSTDWGRMLAQVGGAVAGIRSNFALRSSPDGAVAVSVDGVQVPAIDSRGARVWSYSAATNSVDFTELYTPSFGSVVDVRYDARCLP